MAERDVLVRILGDDRDLQRALTNTERRVQSIDNRTAAFGKNLRTAFATAGISVGISSVAFGLRDIAQSAIDFEEAFAGVRKTVDASEAEFSVLSDGIRELAREIPLTVTELAGIAESAGQLGVAKEDILSFTRTVADLAATTDLTSETAADAFARLTNITGLPQSQVENLGSAVVDLGNKLAATESEIIDFALRIAGAGRQAGLTDAQIVAIAGAFRSVGIEAEAGGTAVQKVLLSMTSAVLSGGKQLEQFARVSGQSLEAFRETFQRDPGEAFVKFVQGLQNVREEGGNTFKVLERLGFSDQRLVRAFLSMSSNSQLLSDSLDIGSAAFRDNIALTEEAEKRYATTASQLQIFKNNVNDVAITLGNEMLQSLNDVVGAVKTLRDGLQLLEDISPIDISVPVSISLEVLVAGRSPSGAKALLGDLKDQVTNAIGGGIRAAIQATEGGIESLLRGPKGGGGSIFTPDRVGGDEPGIRTPEEIAKDVEEAADDAVDSANKVKRARDRQRKAFNEFIKGQGLRLDRAELTKTLDDDIAVLNDIERAILRRIAKEGRTFKLVDQLTQVRQQQATLLEQRADEAEQASEDAFNATMAALDLKLEIAQTTKSLQDDLMALQAIESRILQRIKSEGEATDLMRDLFRVRQEQSAVAKQLADQRRTTRQGQLFEALGLTAEGEERAPSIGALRRRGRNLIDELKASGLEEATVAKFVDRISEIFTDKFDNAGRNIRQAILNMFQTITQALDQGDTSRQITPGGIRPLQRLIAGANLTAEQIEIIQRNMQRRRSGRPVNAFGFDFDGSSMTTGGVMGFPGMGDFGPPNIFVTVEIDGQKVTGVVKKELQKTGKRRTNRRGGAGAGRGAIL